MGTQDQVKVLPSGEDLEEERAGARPEDFEEVFGQGDEFEAVSLDEDELVESDEEYELVNTGEVEIFEDEDTNPSAPAFEDESEEEEQGQSDEIEIPVELEDEELFASPESVSLDEDEVSEPELSEPEVSAVSEALEVAPQQAILDSEGPTIPDDYNLLEVQLEAEEEKKEGALPEPELPFLKRLLAEHPRLPHAAAVVLLAPLAVWASFALEGNKTERKTRPKVSMDEASQAKRLMLGRFTKADRDEAVTAKEVKGIFDRSEQREAAEAAKKRIEQEEQKLMTQRAEELKNDRKRGSYALSPGQMVDPQNLPETAHRAPESGVGVVVGGVPERGGIRRARTRRPQPSKPKLYVPGGSIPIQRSKPISNGQNRTSDQVKGLRPGDLLRVRLVDGVSSQEGGPVIAELTDSFARGGRYILPAETLLRGRARPGDRRFFIEFTEAFVSGRWRKFKGRAVEGGRPGIKAKQRKVTLDARSSAGIARGLVDTTAAVVSGVGGVAGRAAGSVAREVAPEVKEDVTPKEVTILETPARYRFSVRILR